MAKPEYSGPWARIRLKILDRDGYVCQVKGPKCTYDATQVDHIIPVTKGGSWWDESNLRASCRKCNLDRVDHSGQDRWRQGKTRITLVVGPPGAGKARHVADHRGQADLVIDYEAMALALGGGESNHGPVMAARNAVLNSIRRGECDARQAWIISANPEAESLFPFHERVVVDPGEDVVVAGLAQADRPELRHELVHDWYAARAGTSRVPGSSSRDW